MQEGARDSVGLLDGSSLARGSVLSTNCETRRTPERSGEGRMEEVWERGKKMGEESNILSCIYSCQAFTLSCPQSSFLSRSLMTSMLPSPRSVLNLLRRSHEH